MKVRFEPSGREVEVSAGTTVFEAAQRADLPVGSSCGADGTCGRCGLRVLTGSLPPPSERERKVSRDNRVSSDLRLSCMVQVEDDVCLTADYW
jgi:ferredoxin